MAIPCPRCGALEEGSALVGRLTCSACGHQWVPTVASLDGVATEAVGRRETPRMPTPAMPAPRIPSRRSASGEYLPDEPNDPVREVPLTERRDGVPGVLPPTRVAPTPGPRAGQHGSTRSRRVMEVGPPAPAANPAEVGPTIDGDLFDQLEREAQERRSSLPTLPEIAPVQVEPGTSVPTSDRTGLTDCPVCGHRFPVEEAASHHQCPQCGTGWDDSSGRLKVSPRSGDPLIGRTLGGCLIDRKLGEGGMGAVYHARQLSLDRSIAIKILPADLARNKNFIQRFEREAKSLARINSPNILHIYDFGEDPQLGLYYMLIEYVEGMDLGEVINRRGALDQVEVLDLVRQALMGLEAAAEKGIIHRDIKPDNLMVSNAGLVKVSDFGLAKGMVAQTGVTAVGVRVGTPVFMSPEQCDGIDVDVRSDIYNLGATAFLCLTGSLPYDGETPFAIMLKHKSEAVPSLTAIDPTIDRGVERLIQRMLAKRPDDRCTSMRALIEEVERLEVAVAGTQSILRKSRGPFRALLAGRPPTVPAPAAAKKESSHEDWRRLVDDFHAQPDAPAVLPPPPPPPMPSPMPLVVPAVGEIPRRASSRLNIPGTRSDPARGSSTSRRLDAELIQARQRGRRAEWEACIAEGEVHARSGRYDAAARSWEEAARLVDDEAWRADLVLRAAASRSRARQRRRLRRVLVSVGILVTGLVMTGVGAPKVHDAVANRRLTALEDSLRTVPPERRQGALREFQQHETAPWPWYVTIYRQGYELSAADRARTLADEAVPPSIAPLPRAPVADHAAVMQVYRDEHTPWSTVLQVARGQTVTDSMVQEVLRRAAEELELQRIDAAAIAAAWSEGDHRRALENAAAFRVRHPRAEPAQLAALPIAGRVTVSVGGGPVPADASVRIDGVVVSGHPVLRENGEPTMDVRFCRRADRPAAVEVRAAGYRTVAVTIDPTTAADDLQLLLRPQPLWAVPGPEPTAGASLRLAGLGQVVVDRRVQLTRHDLVDGAQRARLERTPGVPAAVTGLLQALPAQRWQTGLGDGSFVQLSPDLIIEQIYQRGASPVIAWLELELTYRPGRRLRLTVEDAPPRRLVAMEGTATAWRYPARTGLTATLAPFVAHVDDQIYLIDDTTMHVIEEDGSSARAFALAARRVGAPVVRTSTRGRQEFLVPTAAGIQHVVPGPRANPISLQAEPFLGTLGPARLAMAGGGAVVVTSASGVALAEPGHRSPRWKAPALMESVWDPQVEGEHAVIADASGALVLYRVADGVVAQRLAHGVPLAAAPLLTPGQVVVLDRSGTLAAYPR